MAGKAITRAFLILALIVTAHIIKPFSIKSVTQHLLYSTKSFRFALPIQLRERFDHANYLAINLSNSLFQADEGIRDFAKVVTTDLDFGPINVQPLDEVNKSATKQKSSQKKSAPAKRIRTEKRSVSDSAGLAGMASAFSLIASVNSDEMTRIVAPPLPIITTTVVPMVPPCNLQVLPARIAAAQNRHFEILLAFRKIDCEKREAERKARIALIEEVKATKGVIRVVGKPKSQKDGLSGSECEDRKRNVVTEEIEVAEPEAEPEDVIAPQIYEEQRSIQFSDPIEKCSREP